MNCLLDSTNAFMLMGKDIVGKPLGAIPFLRHLPPFKSKFDSISKSMHHFRDFIRSTIEERRNVVKGDSECYIDCFLDKIEEDKTGIFTEQQLVHCCMDLFIAGSETTNKSQEYMIAMMLHHPEVLKKVQEELDAVANGRSLVTLSDKENLAYTEATMNECWRYCNVAAFGPPREADVDVNMKGYTIPKGTQVIYNTYSLHMDEDHWGDPKSFRPERFIENGKYVHNERLFPFGIGRRRCLGETLARMENFLFFANLMLNFSFSKVGPTAPSLEPEPGFTSGPYPYKVHIKQRI